MRARKARPAAVALLVIFIMTVLGGAGRDARARLEADGRVTYAYYDEATERPEHTGQAHYQIHFRRNFSFEPRIRTTRGGRTLVLAVRFSQVEVWVEHTIRLPRGHDPDTPDGKRLVEHELDHVAISTDGRPRLLLEHLLRRFQTIEHPLEPGDTPDRELVDRLVTESAEAHHRAVQAIIQANYERLDRLTHHGTRPLPDRPAFFEGLYTPEELERLAFPDLDRLRPFLRSSSYQKAKRYGAD